MQYDTGSELRLIISMEGEDKGEYNQRFSGATPKQVLRGRTIDGLVWLIRCRCYGSVVCGTLLDLAHIIIPGSVWSS